ncbi:hypothetical protein, partial [Promicromonospora sp. NPDC050262]|uniref:hypothetical protein n=1 Tax=Promicromonospora sp. NPDC050262 TaxID=3155036 RepID=UPI0033D4F747
MTRTGAMPGRAGEQPARSVLPDGAPQHGGTVPSGAPASVPGGVVDVAGVRAVRELLAGMILPGATDT